MGKRLASMAWRNLWRHRRRTLITLSSIAFGAFIAVIMTGIGDSQWPRMINLAARMGGGHVTLQHTEYQDRPALRRSVRNAAGLREIALRDPQVERVVTRVTGQLMLSTAAQNYGAAFIAFDPAVEDETTLSVLEALAEGEIFPSADTRGIILGSRLARNLDARLGRKVVYTLADKHGEITREAARVTGILHTGSPSMDAALCLLPIDSFRRAVGYGPDEGVQVAVFLGDHRRAANVASRLGDQIGTEVAALTWRQVQPDLSAFVAMKIGGMQLMEAFILLLVAAGIFNTLFVSVMERVREFGIMMAVGFSPASLFGLVMFESLWLGLVGLVVGGLITSWPYYYLSTTGLDVSAMLGDVSSAEIAGVAMPMQMQIGIYPEHLLAIAGVVLLCTLAAGLYPAWKAGRVVPVESIRLV
ncbi:MAG: FtsX-like permease family protein [Myxococcota bacterium]